MGFLMTVTNGKNITFQSSALTGHILFYLVFKKQKQNKNTLHPPITTVLIKTMPNSLIPTPPSLFRKQY